MNAWFDIYNLSAESRQDEDGIKNSSSIRKFCESIYFLKMTTLLIVPLFTSLKPVLDLVQEEIKNGIPSDKIFIGGFSQGGATALYTALTSPLKFAGVLALSTWLPLHNHFPTQLVSDSNKFSMPFFLCHGDADPMVPLEWSKKSGIALKALGFTSVTDKTYRGLGHSSSEEASYIEFSLRLT